MKTGALIVAAGMSSRMGDFKPMLNIGSISISQRISATFRQSGIEKIVMVTGFNAIELERHLAGNGIVFLRNENFETTHMFDSAKIGLSYLKDKVDRILFTPVDIPLFTADTVKALMKSRANLACPVHGGEPGHPILISSSLVDIIVSDPGDRGLQGAIENCGTKMERIAVKDAGILHDADTPEDYRALLDYHNAQLIRPELSVSLAREMPFFDEEMAMLFTLINENHSVRASCQQMQISYSTGWNIIRTLESQLSRPLIKRTQGGAHGGASALTKDGEKLLGRYKAYSEKIKKYASEIFTEYFGDILKND